MEEAAHSISLTTITTLFAFLLGLRSSLPGVQWLCLCKFSFLRFFFSFVKSHHHSLFLHCLHFVVFFYSIDAFTTILIDFIFQITMYCSFIVLDERRIQANKRDICIWMPDSSSGGSSNTEPKIENTDNQNETEKEIGPTPIENIVPCELNDAIVDITSTDGNDSTFISDDEQQQQRKNIPERIMSHYANFLLKPWIKAIVLVAFAALLGCCFYSVTLLEQEVS